MHTGRGVCQETLQGRVERKVRKEWFVHQKSSPLCVGQVSAHWSSFPSGRCAWAQACDSRRWPWLQLWVKLLHFIQEKTFFPGQTLVAWHVCDWRQNGTDYASMKLCELIMFDHFLSYHIVSKLNFANWDLCLYDSHFSLGLNLK